MKKTAENLLSYFVNSKTQKITDEDIEFYRNNPEELELIVNKEVLQLSTLSYFFVVAIIISIASKVLPYFFEDVWGRFMNEVVFDLVFEFGVALLGGVVTAFFLEILQKKQYEQNVCYRARILAKIKK